MKYRDFDAFWAQKAKEPAQVRIMGQEYNLPAEMPASLVIRFMRMNDGREITAEDLADGGVITEIIDGLFGKGTLGKWLDKGMTFPQLLEIVQYIAGGFQDSAASGEDGEASPLTS